MWLHILYVIVSISKLVTWDSFFHSIKK